MTTDTPCFCPPFTPMARVLTPQRIGRWGIEAFTLTEAEVKHAQTLAFCRGEPGETHWLEAGEYRRLMFYGRPFPDVVMSDTGMERLTNLQIVQDAHGRVLIGGLGLGMILLPMLNKAEVTHITVLEREADVIALVWPQLEAYLGARAHKITVMQANVFDFRGERGELWDTIYFDIWSGVGGGNYAEMKRLHRAYARRLNRDNRRAHMDSWRRDDCRRYAKGQWR